LRCWLGTSVESITSRMLMSPNNPPAPPVDRVGGGHELTPDALAAWCEAEAERHEVRARYEERTAPCQPELAAYHDAFAHRYRALTSHLRAGAAEVRERGALDVTDEMVRAAMQVDMDTWQAPPGLSEEALDRGRSFYRAVLEAALAVAPAPPREAGPPR
jgi:hypothetical protein